MCDIILVSGVQYSTTMIQQLSMLWNAHHVSALQYYWLYSLCCTFHLMTYLFYNWKSVHLFYKFISLFWERERMSSLKGAERAWDRGSEAALYWQRRSQCGAQTHELRDPDLSSSWILNRLSHPGTPGSLYILIPFT